MISFFSFIIRREQKFKEVSDTNKGQNTKGSYYFQKGLNGNSFDQGKSGILENYENIEKKWDSLVQMINIQDIDDENNNPYKEKLKIKKKFKQLF
jgi:hypothetical protein